MQCSYGTCKTKPIWRYSPDIDVNGLLACDAHKNTVQMAYMVLLSGNEALCLDLLKHTKKTKPTE
jgi:hypothetical protein